MILEFPMILFLMAKRFSIEIETQKDYVITNNNTSKYSTT